MALVDDTRIKGNMNLRRGWGLDDLDAVKHLLSSDWSRAPQTREAEKPPKQDSPHRTTQPAYIASLQRLLP